MLLKSHNLKKYVIEHPCLARIGLKTHLYYPSTEMKSSLVTCIHCISYSGHN